MKEIYFVTIPRSGHHITIDIIKEIAHQNSLPFSYCEFYNHQGCTHCPCDEKDHPFKIYKSHDFELSPECIIPEWKHPLHIHSDHIYIIMYRRDPIRQFESWYRHYVDTYPDKSHIRKFPIFLRANIEHYSNFIQKWLYHSKDYANIHSFAYEDFLSDPRKVIQSILALLYPENHSSIKGVDDIIDTFDVRYKHNISVEQYDTIRSLLAHYPESWYTFPEVNILPSQNMDKTSTV